MPRTPRLLALSALLLTAAPLAAQTSYPMITHTAPVAVRRGQTAEVTVSGRMNFAGAYKVLLEGEGVAAEVVQAAAGKAAKAPANVTSVKLRVDVAPGAPLGVREFRVATERGISTLGQLLVVADPVVSEKGPNDTPDKAVELPLPGVACGFIEKAEDVDCFRFRGRAGQVVTFDVFCARLQDKIHDLQKHADPLIVLLDAEGRELAASDDGTFADPLLEVTLPKDGDYVLQIRDAVYAGDPRWVYAVQATDRPYVRQIFPLAVNPGRQTDVEPVGSAARSQTRVALTAPEEAGVHAVSLRIGDQETNPAALVVTPLPLSNEAEPNDEPAKANKLAIPGGVNGRAGKARDLDHFAFRGAKGKALRFEVFARRFGTVLTSDLDAIVEVLSAEGAVVASNDDAEGKDPVLVFTPPADGDYLLRVRDLHGKGGDTFGYFLQAEPARPDFSLRCDPSKAMVGPGSRAAWYVQVKRENGFAGPVKVEVKGLPKGVSVNDLTIPPEMTQGVLVLSAAPDAPKGAANVEIVGTATVKTPEGKEETLTRRPVAVEEIYLPGGGRGLFDVRLQSVAVTGPSDILDVRVKPEKLVLKPGQEVKLDVTIKRRDDYQKDVTLDIPLRHLNRVYATPLPPGVTMLDGKSKTRLGAGNTGHITLKVAPDAKPIKDVPINVIANVSVNFVVKVSYSSAPILVTIEK